MMATMTVHELVNLMRDIGHIGFQDQPETFLADHPEIQIAWAQQQMPVIGSYLQMAYDTKEEIDRTLTASPIQTRSMLYQMRAGMMQQIERLERCQAGIFMFIRGRLGHQLN